MGGEGFWFLLVHVTKFDTYNETKALYSPFQRAKSQRTLTGRDRPTPRSGFRGGSGDTCRSRFGSRSRQRCFGGGQSSGGLLLVLVVAVGVDGLGADHCGVKKASRNAIDWTHEFLGMRYLRRRRSRGSGGAWWRPRRGRPLVAQRLPETVKWRMVNGLLSLSPVWIGQQALNLTHRPLGY
jgi:hypothetical protein